MKIYAYIHPKLEKPEFIIADSITDADKLFDEKWGKVAKAMSTIVKIMKIVFHDLSKQKINHYKMSNVKGSVFYPYQIVGYHSTGISQTSFLIQQVPDLLKVINCGKAFNWIEVKAGDTHVTKFSTMKDFKQYLSFMNLN